MITKKEYSASDAQPVIIYGKGDNDTTVAIPIRLDRATNTIQTIEYEHHEIHAGSSFTASTKADVANAAILDLLIVTPNTTKWSHLTYEFDVEAETDIDIYENVVCGTGTTIAVYNRDRNSAVTAGTIVQQSPATVTTGTTVLRTYHAGNGKSVGGGSRGSHEFILKQNTKYLVRLTNATTSNNYMAVKFDWYEHSNPN